MDDKQISLMQMTTNDHAQLSKSLLRILKSQFGQVEQVSHDE